MPKTIETYRNTLLSSNAHRWQPIEGMEDMAEEVTLAIDEKTGDYTRLTRCLSPGQIPHHSVQIAMNTGKKSLSLRADRMMAPLTGG